MITSVVLSNLLNFKAFLNLNLMYQFDLKLLSYCAKDDYAA